MLVFLKDANEKLNGNKLKGFTLKLALKEWHVHVCTLVCERVGWFLSVML